MIIACPACNTRYVVPDSAIGVDGRTVRCAKCKHSWFQDGPDLPPRDAPAPAAPAAAAAEEARPQQPEAPVDHTQVNEDERVPDFDSVDPPFSDLPGDRAGDRTRADAGESGAPGEQQGSHFDYAPPFRPRRNWIKLWTWAAAIFAILTLGTIAAVNYLGVPDWVPIERPLFAVAEPDLKLEFPVEEQERRTLANGTEFFGARVTVTNEARESRNVPPILIVLRDARERIVFSWEVMPPKKTLAPGEAMTINEAITDVPRSAVFADIGWAPR